MIAAAEGRWVLPESRGSRTGSRFGLLTVRLVLLTLLQATGRAHGQSPMMAGTAIREITPPIGYPHYRGVSTAVHDPLHAKALVFRQGDRRAALVIADLIAITPGLSSEVRTLIAAGTGIPFSHIIVAATHTHTGPEYRDAMESYVARKRAGTATPEDEAGYLPRLVRGIAQAAIDADAAARPVQLQTAVGEARGISFNRRFYLRNGVVRMNPGLRNPDVVRPAGPVDPDVNVLLLRPAGGGAPIASLTVFANHLDTVGDTAFSADYPYYLSGMLRQTFGPSFVSIFGTGTTGDINHVDVNGGPGQKGHEAVTRRIGETLGRVVREEVQRARPVRHPSLDVRSEYVYAPLQEYTDAELAWAKSGSTEPFYPERESQQAVRRRKILVLEELRRSGAAIPPTVGTERWRLPLEVQVIRLGEDAAIVGLPGEVFVELGMAIEKASPFARTYVIELTNVNIAYVPTREGFAQGDYEAVASRVAPGGGEMLVDAAVRLLRELKDDQTSAPSAAF